MRKKRTGNEQKRTTALTCLRDKAQQSDNKETGASRHESSGPKLFWREFLELRQGIARRPDLYGNAGFCTRDGPAQNSAARKTGSVSLTSVRKYFFLTMLNLGVFSGDVCEAKSLIEEVSLIGQHTGVQNLISLATPSQNRSLSSLSHSLSLTAHYSHLSLPLSSLF